MEFIPIFEKLGLNNSDSLIFFTLIQFGEKGTTVYGLIQKMESHIKRTTIYSILKKLSTIGYIEELSNPNTARHAKIFRAISPKKLIALQIQNMREKLHEIESYQEIFENELEMVYSSHKKYAITDLDPQISPYVQEFVNSGWDILSYNHRDYDPIFQYSIFECFLKPVNSRIFHQFPFHLFKFNYDISQDSNALAFTIKSIKNQSKELIGIFGNIKNFQLKDYEFQYSNWRFPAYTLQIDVNKVNKHPLYNEILDFLQLDREKLPDYVHFGVGIIIPIKEILFFFWAESELIVTEALKIIFKINKQPFSRSKGV